MVRPAPALRLLVGVTGGGGAGKSTLAHVLAHCLRALPPACFAASSPANVVPAVHVLGVDGYHLSSAELRAANLQSVKGTPPTIHAAALLADLRRLGEPVDSGVVRLPQYSRELHEPIAAAGPSVATADPAVVLVEGVHL
eukprot:SAG31_NODE_2247_length_6094_cov_6.426522_5_plen_140_part_00